MNSSSNFDTAEFLHAMSQFATGVVVVTGNENGELVGFAAQSFVSLSLDPPLVLFCPQKTSTSWPRIRATGAYCINVLGDEHARISEAFAVVGEVANVDWTPSNRTNSPVLTESIACIDCVLHAEHDAGDHTIAISSVIDIAVDRPDAGPLLYLRGEYGRFARLNDA